jgi:hypothetical protein
MILSALDNCFDPGSLVRLSVFAHVWSKNGTDSCPERQRSIEIES